MKKLTENELKEILPIIIKDLKHHRDPDRRDLTVKNLQEDLYKTVIRQMSNKDVFLHIEKLNDGTSREGLFIKGLVRDVWEYLEDAYELIHNYDYSEYLK